jgi:AAA family ATP:ADP antiporter
MSLSKHAHEIYDKTKTLYLSIAYSAIIAGYSIIRPLKSSIFVSFVGIDYVPYAKILSFCMAPLLMFVYSKLLNASHRHKIATIFFGIYAAAISLFSVLLLHPGFGLENTVASPHRILGWIIYLFLDFFNVLILETFWGFTNSISSSHFAKEKYSDINANARIAGIASPLVALFIGHQFQDIISFPIFCILTSILLTVALVSLQKITNEVPEEYLAGYSKDHEAHEVDPTKKSNWLDGLKLLLKEPYVLGIFVLIYSFNFVSTFADFQMQALASKIYKGAGAYNQFMLVYTILFQILGYIFSKVGASSLLKRFGLPFCLLVSPAITFGLLLALINFKSLIIATITMVVFRALNYGFNVPVREMLFIPTTETIQFKSKAWITSFGQTLSEGPSSFLNNPYMIASVVPSSVAASPVFGFAMRFFTAARPLVSLGLTLTWFVAAVLLGTKYQDTITHGKVIGRRNPKKAL